MNNNREKLTKEIDNRLRSDIWDYKIARTVMAQRKLKSEKMLTMGSYISTAVAAIAIFVFVFDLATGINGSYNTESYYQVSADSETGLYAAAEVDYIINEAYPMR
jgi:hypothetical protein